MQGARELIDAADSVPKTPLLFLFTPRLRYDTVTHTATSTATITIALAVTVQVLDYQFAVIPRHLADAYFQLESPCAASAARELQFARDFDLTAIQDTYGSHDPDSYMRTCSPTGFRSPYGPTNGTCTAAHNWSDLFDRFMGGGFKDYAAGSTLGSTGSEYSRRTDARLACCETRLTWRLTGRLVPVRVHPFEFVLSVRSSNTVANRGPFSNLSTTC